MRRNPSNDGSGAAFFARKQKYSLPPAWSYRADGLLWRFIFSGAGHIVGEARDPQKKTASFFCLDEATGAVLWENLHLDEPWWTGIETADAHRVYLHGFRKPDMPQHLGIVAVDIATGKFAWSNPDDTFLFVDGDTVYTSRQGFEAMRYSAFDASTGAFLREIGTDPAPMNELRARLNEVDVFAGYEYPVHFDRSHPRHEQLAPVIEKLVPLDAVRGNLDVLARASLLLISWHEALPAAGSPPAVRQHFLAYDLPTGAVVYHDVLNESMEMPGIDSFFIKDTQVLYIKDACILTAHSLTA